MKRNHRIALATAAAAASLVGAQSATADSTPVGPLPKGPTTSVVAPRGSLVAVALPRQKASTGLVWRLARRVDAKVLRQVSEADVGASGEVVFRTGRAGSVRVSFALTRGDASAKAVRAAYWAVRVR
jgi:hypothetical protein